MRRRSGFTVFDLLLILAILGILLGLLLPAIQKVRQAAARVESQNNLKQIGLACHSYHDTYGALPPLKGKKDASVLVSLLPFIEQANLYNEFQNNGIKALKGTSIRTYTSPRDPMDLSEKRSFNNYLFNAGTKYSLTKNNGVFTLKSKSTLTQLINADGVSNTIMTGETLVGKSAKDNLSVARQHVSLRKKALNQLGPKSGIADFKNNKNISFDRGHRWYDPTFLQTAFTMTRKINDTRPDVNCGGEGGISGLRSVDRETNIGLCDGSVRFAHQTVNFKTLQALSTWNGNEEIGNDF